MYKIKAIHFNRLYNRGSLANSNKCDAFLFTKLLWYWLVLVYGYYGNATYKMKCKLEIEFC